MELYDVILRTSSRNLEFYKQFGKTGAASNTKSEKC